MDGNMFDLTNKRALVTGATGGIGSAIVRRFIKSGATVAATGTRLEKLQALTDEFGDGVRTLQYDLSKADSIRELSSAATDALGSVDILVNNAGITRDSLFLRLSEGDWNDVIAVNLNAAMLLSKGVLRGMMKSRWGRIINVTSVIGSTGNPGQANYAASKAALTGFGKSLAAEVASRGITVNALAPGFIATEMTEELSDKQRERILENVPVGRMGTADEIAAGALFLASEEAGYVTGQTLHVNGGLAMI